MIKIFLKDNLNQRNHEPFDQIVPQIQFEINGVVVWSKFVLCIVFCSNFSKKSIMDRTVLSFDQDFLKRQYGLNSIVLSQKTVWVEPYWLLVKIFQKDNMGWTVLLFGQSFLKRLYQLNDTVFWSKFSKKTIGLHYIVFWSMFS